jgi:putative membrane protein
MMVNVKHCLALAVAIPSVGTAQMATSASASTTPAAVYVAKAGASDMYEKQSSQLVLQSTTDAKIRQFADMMLRDHTTSTEDVKAAAATDRIAVPAPKLEPAQAKMIADLRAASGPVRDKLYVKQQRMAHQQALALHSGFAQSGDKAALKGVAAATAPVVQHHIEMLQSM